MWPKPRFLLQTVDWFPSPESFHPKIYSSLLRTPFGKKLFCNWPLRILIFPYLAFIGQAFCPSFFGDIADSPDSALRVRLSPGRRFATVHPGWSANNRQGFGKSLHSQELKLSFPRTQNPSDFHRESSRLWTLTALLLLFRNSVELRGSFATSGIPPFHPEKYNLFPSPDFRRLACGYEVSRLPRQLDNCSFSADFARANTRNRLSQSDCR